MTERPSVRTLISGLSRVATTIAGIVLLGIAFDRLLGIRLPGGWPLRALGLVAFAIGLALETAGTRAFWIYGSGTPAAESHPKKLVTDGPYSWSRHPLYLARHLMLLGLAGLLESPSILLLTAVLFILVQFVMIPREEARLATRFDGLYEDYRKRVGKWITVRQRGRR